MGKSRYLINEFFWYFLGAFIPMVVGIIKTTVFTRVFNAEDFGRYGIIYISFLIISIILLTWNMNVIWRYYHYFDKFKGRHFFLSNVFFLLIFQIVVFVVVSLFFVHFVSDRDQYLIILFIIQIVVSHILNSILTLFRVYSLTRSFNIVQIIRTSLSLLLMFYLVFIRNHTIEVFVETIILTEIPLIFILIILYRNILIFRLSRISWTIQRLIFKYIPPSLVSNLGLILLAYSDRYIINLYDGLKPTGIYNQAYTLAMMGLNSLILIFIKIVTPKFVQVLEKGSFNSDVFLKNTLLLYSVLILPVTVYFSIYAKEVVMVFMGPEFHESYVIIPWINFGIYLSGLIYFFELRRKFMDKNLSVVVFYIVTIILNLVLNIFFVPIFGYMAAAYTTFLVYVVLLLLFLGRSEFRFFKDEILLNKSFIVVILILILQCLFHFFIRFWIKSESELAIHIAEGVTFLITYLIIVFKIKSIKMVVNKFDVFLA